jgi:hypothetical protein
MRSIGLGYHLPCQGVKEFSWLDWLQSVGQSRKAGIGFALRKKHLKNPSELLFSACALLRYWSGLQAEDM